MSCNINFTFDLAAVILILSELYLRSDKVWEVDALHFVFIGGYRCATSWCDLEFIFDLAIVTLTFKF